MWSRYVEWLHDRLCACGIPWQRRQEMNKASWKRRQQMRKWS